MSVTAFPWDISVSRSAPVAARTPARRPSRPPRPRPEPERGRCLARESLRPSDSSWCLVTGVFLHTVEAAAILETLETRVRPGSRSMRKTIVFVPWPRCVQAASPFLPLHAQHKATYVWVGLPRLVQLI